MAKKGFLYVFIHATDILLMAMMMMMMVMVNAA